MGIRSHLLPAFCLAGLLMTGAAGTIQAHEETVETQQGMASFYGDKFQGRATASGEPFDQRQLTAAHPSLPFGTRVLVTRRDTGSEVEVLINDRGPFVKGRIIDLSKQAARELGMINRGVAPVMITSIQGS
jgi:rare lipoprotein A